MRRNIPRAWSLVIFALALALALVFPALRSSAAGGVELVADVAPGSFAGGESGPWQDFRTVLDRSVFKIGEDLWASDGTAQGTNPIHFQCRGCQGTADFVSDAHGQANWLRRGPDGRVRLWRSRGFPRTAVQVAPGLSFDGAIVGDEFFFYRGALFFLATDAQEAAGVWALEPGQLEPVSIHPGHRVLSGGIEFEGLGGEVFFFLSGTQPEGDGLWKTQVSPLGESTQLVKSFGLEGAGSFGLTRVGDRLCFIADLGEGQELWVTDGSPQGTMAITQFVANQPVFEEGWIHSEGDHAYFLAREEGMGLDLWRTDGTAAGTGPVTAMVGSRPFDLHRREDFQWLGERIVFLGEDAEGDLRLWRSDGTPESAQPLLGAPGEPEPVLGSPLYKAGSHVFLKVRGASGGERLWMSDGTALGTRPASALCGEACSGALEGIQQLDGEVAFVLSESGAESGSRSRLWVTGGTAESTWSPQELLPRDVRVATNPNSSWLTQRADAYVFSALEPDHGLHLWDVTPEDAVRVLEFPPTGFDSNPFSVTEVDGRLVFRALHRENQSSFRALWAVDPTASSPVPRILPDEVTWDGFHEVNELHGSGSQAFVIADRRGELWRTKGTPESTLLLRRWSDDPPFDTAVAAATSFGEGLLFSVNSGSRCDLWFSDGSEIGTKQAVNLTDQSSCLLSHLTEVGQVVYFLAQNVKGVDGPNVWRSDGTAAGTFALTNFSNTNFRSWREPRFSRHGDRVLFFYRASLWSSDGSLESTAPVKELISANQGGASELVEMDGVLYFLAEGQGIASPLWRTDGTAEGTAAVGGFPPDSLAEVDLEELVAFAGNLYFQGWDEQHGRELWRSDGSGAGTERVEDILEGPESSEPHFLTPAGHQLFFVAHDGYHGEELWRLGEGGVPSLVQDLNPGPASSHALPLRVVGDFLVFRATDGLVGLELWRYPVDGEEISCEPSERTLCLNEGRFQVSARWRNFQGQEGEGTAVPLTADTGYFWFFNPLNVEAVVKVLDGRSLNDHFWTFYGALSNVSYSLTVTDTETGGARRYFNPLRQFASLGDTFSFGPLGAGSTSPPLSSPFLSSGQPRVLQSQGAGGTTGCVPNSTRLCLNEGRFAVEARWEDFSGNVGVGQAVSLTEDTGYFWFFRDTNVETILKVLDGREQNGHFWVFYGALSNVDYDLIVTDTETGEIRTYLNRDRQFASVGDTEAF